MDMPYTVSYKDSQGDNHDVTVAAHSGTHALTVAMDQYEELKLYPNRITRVHKEGTR